MAKSKHQRFMSVARALARVSDAPDLKVGAVIVYSGQIIASGWNFEDNFGALHAEARAINLQGDKFSRAPTGVMYVTTSPCLACAQHIINDGGINKVYYQHEWWDKAARELLEENHIEVTRVKREGRHD